MAARPRALVLSLFLVTCHALKQSIVRQVPYPGRRMPAKAKSIFDPQDNMSPYKETLFQKGKGDILAELEVGHMMVFGRVDTISPEVIVFGRDCEGCNGPGYVKWSPDAQWQDDNSTHNETFYIDEGGCKAHSGFESVTTARGYNTDNQLVWVADKCFFPESSAKVEWSVSLGFGIPSCDKKLQPVDWDLHRELGFEKDDSASAEKAACHDWSLLTGWNLNRFSICMCHGGDARGQLNLNPPDPSTNSLVKRHPLAGSHMWSLKIWDFHFRYKGKPYGPVADCGINNCVGVLDSATPLLGVPHHVYVKVEEAWRNNFTNCSDLSIFPEFAFFVGESKDDPDGTYIKLDARAYLNPEPGTETRVLAGLSDQQLGAPPLYIPDKTGTEVRHLNPPVGCDLLLLDMGDTTTNKGALYVLGLPFFKQYVVTFDNSGGDGHRFTTLQEAKPDCDPVYATAEHHVVEPWPGHEIPLTEAPTPAPAPPANAADAFKWSLAREEGGTSQRVPKKFSLPHYAPKNGQILEV